MDEVKPFEGSGGGEAATILIVDDSALVRGIIKESLANRGFNSIEAGSGKEALRILGENPVSLITMDVDMPGDDGFEVCRKVRTQESAQGKGKRRRLPVIFVTSQDGIRTRAKGFEVGAHDYIVKSPQLAVDLVNAVERCLRPEKVFKDVKVLIMDDSTVVRNMVQQWVVSLGAEAVQAGDGGEGFAKLQKDPSEYDVLILDHQMPNMSGLEICKLARRVLGLKIPIFIVTGSDEPELQLTFFDAGATDFLVKPFLKEELAARLRVHLQNAKRSRQIDRLTGELHLRGDTLKREIFPILQKIKGAALQIREDPMTQMGENGFALLDVISTHADMIEKRVCSLHQNESMEENA